MSKRILAAGAFVRRRIPEGLPHIHHGQPDAGRLPRAEPSEERIEARCGPVGAPEPDRPPPHQIAHDDAIGVALPDGHLVDPNDRWGRGAGAPELLLHVLHLERFDRLPVQVRLARHILNRRGPAATPHEEGESLGVERGVGEEVQPLLLHPAAPTTGHPADLDVQVGPASAGGEIAHSARLPIVPSGMQQPTGAAACFLARRVRVMTRAWGSPKIPTTVGLGWNPGKRYRSHSRRWR